MNTGKVSSYDADRVEGYIRPDGEDNAIPFDEDSLAHPDVKAELREGLHVRFKVEGGMAGLSCADVEPVDE